MNKKKIINIINLIVIGICLTIDLILGVIFDFDSRFFISSVLFIGGIGVINLIFIAVKEGMILSYDSNKFDYVLNAIYSFIGVLAYYILKYVDGYDDYGYLYWIIFIVLIVIITVIFLVLRMKVKTKNDKPRFIVNK